MRQDADPAGQLSWPFRARPRHSSQMALLSHSHQWPVRERNVGAVLGVM